MIFDRYIHTNDGINGVANYLNNHGYTKKLRQNGTIPRFSASFIKKIIDNPIYMGKIAYGRRRTEKKTGTRNETHVVKQSEFSVYEGVHEAIISEEDWDLAQEKRSKNNYKREKNSCSGTCTYFVRNIKMSLLWKRNVWKYCESREKR